MKAFPRQSIYYADTKTLDKQDGMELRDYFAAAALTGICAHLGGAEKRGNETSQEAHARWAFLAADAMLKARHS